MNQKQEARYSLENSYRAPDKVNDILSKPYGPVVIGLAGAFAFLASPYIYIAIIGLFI